MLQCDMDCQAQPNHQVSFLPSSAQAKLIQAGLRLALFSNLAGRPAGRPGKVSSEQAKGPSGLKIWKICLLN